MARIRRIDREVFEVLVEDVGPVIAVVYRPVDVVGPSTTR
jgi:hypothetical protein